MRRLAPVLLLLAAGCSRGTLQRADAEAAIRARYPVTVPVLVPASVSAAANAPEAQRAQAFMDNLQKTNWFDITKTEGKDGQVTFTFKPRTGSPTQMAPGGWDIPAAQAVFVKALGHNPKGAGIEVPYEIRLSNPTAQFPLLALLHPNAHINDTKSRHATFERQHGSWVLTSTDEAFTKAQ